MSVHRPSGQWTPTTSPTHLHSRCPPLVPWWKILTLPGLQIRWVWSGCGLDTHACSRGEFTVTTTVWTGTAVRGATAFILTHVFVDQVSVVRVWPGHTCLFKGWVYCNHHRLDGYSCSGCDCFHPDTCICGSGECGQGVAWTVCLACSRGTFTATATIWTGTAVQGVTAFILTHVLVDQVSLVRVWMGHACLLKGYIHCNRHYLDMYSCSGCDHFHPDIYTCGSGESVSSGCVHLSSFVLTHIPTQGSQFRVHLASSWHIYLWIRWVSQFKVHPPPSWHAYLWIIKTVSSGYLHFHLWHKYLWIR